MSEGVIEDIEYPSGNGIRIDSTGYIGKNLHSLYCIY